MEKEFVPYELAVKLKELGFNESCFGVFQTQENNKLILQYFEKSSLTFATHLLPAPTFSQVFRWFRDKHNLDKVIDNWSKQPMNNDEVDEIWDKAYQYYINGEAYHPYFKTHEEAELACLEKLIEIVKN